MKEQLKKWLERLEQSKLAPLVQFVKFGLVGLTNTLISYAVDQLMYYVVLSGVWQQGQVTLLGQTVAAPDLKVWVCKTLGFIAGVINSYIWNSRYVFKAQAGEKRSPWRSFLRLAASSVLTSLVLSTLLTQWLLGLGAPYYLATLAALVVTIPLNFLLSKFWAFRGKKAE